MLMFFKLILVRQTSIESKTASAIAIVFWQRKEKKRWENRWLQLMYQIYCTQFDCMWQIHHKTNTCFKLSLEIGIFIFAIVSFKTIMQLWTNKSIQTWPTNKKLSKTQTKTTKLQQTRSREKEKWSRIEIGRSWTNESNDDLTSNT